MLLECRECGENLSSNIEGPCIHCGEPLPFECFRCEAPIGGPLTEEINNALAKNQLLSSGPCCYQHGLVYCHLCESPFWRDSEAVTKIVSWSLNSRDTIYDSYYSNSDYFCFDCANKWQEPRDPGRR